MKAWKIPHTKFICAGLIFLISFIPRLFLLSQGPFDVDTLDYVISGKKVLASFHLFYAHGAGYPLSVIFSAFAQGFLRYFGINEMQAIMMTAAFLSSISAVLCFLLIDAIFQRKRIALFSALFFSLSPAFFSVTTHGRIDHALNTGFIFLALYFLQKKNLPYILLSGICLGMAITARFASTVFILPWIFFYFLSHKKMCFKKLLLGMLAVILPIIFLYLPMFLRTGLWQFILVITNPFHAKWLGFFSPVLPHSLQFLLIMLSYPGIFLTLSGAYMMWKEKKTIMLFLIFWFVTTFFYLANLSSISPRYLILSTIPLFIFMGYIIGKIQYTLLSLSITGFVIIWTILPIYPILQFRHTHNLQRDFAYNLKKTTKPNDLILVHDEKMFFDYYLEKSRRTKSPPITCNQKNIMKFLERMNGALKKHNVYVVETTFSYDPCNLLKSQLEKNYYLIQKGVFLNEDWHHKTLDWGIMEERIFQIIKK